MEEDVLHPIERLCQSLLRDGKKGQERAVFVSDAQASLSSAVDRYLTSLELLEVVDTLNDLADDIEDELTSPKAAGFLRKILERAVVTSAVQDLQHQLEAKSGHARFAAFVGEARRPPQTFNPHVTPVPLTSFGTARRV